MHNKRGGHLRLVRSLRDQGTLLWGARGQQPVVYALDLYRQGEMLTGNGDVRGDLTMLVGRSPADVRLRLAGGDVVSVALTDVEPDNANIEVLGPIAPGGAQ